MRNIKNNLLSLISLAVALCFITLAFVIPDYSLSDAPGTSVPGETVGDYNGTSRIIAGSGGWLFRAYGQTTSEYEDYTGANLFTDSELSAIASKLLQGQETLSYEGCEAYFVFVPSRMCVYSSALPENVRAKQASQRRYTQLISYLNEKTTLKTVDLSSNFAALRDTNQLFDNADEKVNDIGGFYIYNAAVKSLNADVKSGLYYREAGWNEYLLTLESDGTRELTEDYKSFSGKTVENRTYIMNEKYTPYISVACAQDDITASEVPFQSREADARYDSVIVYNTGGMDAARKYFSAFSSRLTFCDTMTVDESVLDTAKPDKAVFLIGESNLSSLAAGGGALIGDDTETSATPVVIATAYNDVNKLVIFGTAEACSTVSVRGGESAVSCRAEDGSFVIEVTIKEEDTSVLRLTAVTDGKAESAPRKINAEYDYDNGYRSVIIGKDGHLHYDATEADYLGYNLYSQEQLAELKGYLSAKAAAVKAVSPNTKIIYLIAPNHLTIYPETAPDWLAEEKQTENSRLQQLYDYFADFEDVKFINVRDRLLAEKEKTDFLIYNKTDTHWNELGAYYACCELLNYVAEDFPAAAPDPLENFTVVSKSVTGGDMANFLRVDLTKVREYGTFVRSKTPLKTGIEKQYIMDFENAQFGDYHEYNIAGEGLPTMVMYRDSFATNMVSFLSEKFSRSVYNGISSYELDLEQIAAEQPDYLIFEFVERSLGGLS